MEYRNPVIGIKMYRIRREADMKKAFLAVLTGAIILSCWAVMGSGTDDALSKNEMGYYQISQEEAKELMDSDGTQIIVDVRTREEYREGHIPGAICIPNESITDEMPEALPDPDQIILIYCRSGRRSKEAAGKLAQMGYTRIYEFGGIIDWKGEVVSGDEKQEETDMRMKIGDTEVPVTWEDNASVDALKELAAEDDLIISMSMYGGFEQVGDVGQEIVSDDTRITTEAGDIVLYARDRIVVFYGSNTWEYTRLGHIDLPAEEMQELLGNGDIELRLFTEDSF